MGMKFLNKNAFSLSEVLIALGIIGVIAAITLPSLIQNHKKQVIETRLKRFYTNINQAIILSEQENDDRKNWAPTTSSLSPEEWFNTYLSKYLRTLKVESGPDRALIYLNDGSMFTFNKYIINFYPYAKDYKTCKAKSSCIGTKNFAFYYAPNSSDKNHKNKGVEPYKYSWNGKAESLKTSTTYGCSKDGGKQFCTAIIQINGWKIPDDYPFRF